MRIWKKALATCCTIVMFVMIPALNLGADELHATIPLNETVEETAAPVDISNICQTESPNTIEDAELEVTEAVDSEAVLGSKEDIAQALSFSQSKIIDDITVTVEADSGVFPSDAVLSVTKVSKETKKAIADIVEEVRDANAIVAVSYTFDISILDSSGNELQPYDDQNITVSFSSVKVDDPNLTADIYHISDEGEIERLEIETLGDQVSADTDGFSYYTVEFTYNKNQYVLQGDESVALGDILEVIGLIGEVTDVECSNQDLFSAEYNGEWIVTANQAFTSEEWMKVTINGIKYEIVVTDSSYGVNLNSPGYATNINPFTAKGYYGQCTWYCWGRAYEKGVSLSWGNGSFGNAIDWYRNAAGNYVCDQTPSANSIMVSPDGGYYDSNGNYHQTGHVMFVEKVEGGYAYITEGNYNGQNYHEDWIQLSTGRRNWGSGAAFSITGYIHLKNPTPTVSFTPWNNDNYTYIRETDASIGMRIDVAGGTCTYTGMYLFDSGETFLAEGYNESYTYPQVYFQINSEMGYTLRPGTTYKYKFYAIVNEQWFWSDMYSFTTPPPAVTNINNCTVTLSATSYTYNGSARTPSVTVKNGSTTLTSGTDYTVSYSNNVNAGTATVTITGKGYYTGTVYRTFTINKAAATLSFASGSINKTDLNTTFTNTLTKTTDGIVTFKSSNTAVATVNSSSGLVTTRGVGTATITATSTEGNNYKAASASYTLTVGIVVGNNVFATFDETTGAVEFYSNNGELWRDWVEKIRVEKTKITSLKIASGKVYLPKDSSNIFAIGEDAPFIHDSNLKELDLSGFDTSRVTNMSEMFLGCGILTELDLRNFNTSKVTNMSGMFKDCRELTALDLSSFDTSNVTDMSYMFSANMAFQVYHLKRLNLESFNTSKVKNMSYMFYGCYEMPSLDLSNFDTSNVTDMSYMFNWCQNLTSLNIKNFVTSNVSNMASMFAECYNLTELDVSGFDTSNVTNMGVMFGRCRSLTKLDVSSFDTSNVTGMGAMFSGCQGLTKLDVSSFDTSNVTRMQLMFSSCANLTNLDLSSFDTSKVNIMRWMFSGCTNLKSLNLSNFSISNVEDMGEMFEGCSSLESLDLSSFNKSLVPVSMNHMFWNCSSLRELNLRGFDTSKTTSIGGMFSGCSSLTKVDLSSFDTSNVTDMRAIFSGCNSLTSIDLSSFNTSNLIDMQAAFEGCSSLLSIDLSSFDTSNLKGELATYNVFLGCSKLELLKTPKKQTIASIALPYNMYDSAGNVYTELPLLSKSIVLTKSKSTSLQNCSITLSSTSYTFDGKEKKPAVTVKNGTTTLTNNTDYTVAYSDNTNAGTAKVTVTGKGNYAGIITKSFSISKATPSLKFANASLSKTTTDAAFTNTLTKTTDGTVTFKSSNTAVATVNSTSGRVTIKGTGKTTITATATEGTNYKAGSAKYTLTVTESGAVQSISLSETSITMVCGNERAVPSVSYNPESATDGKTVNWISSNEKLVKVSDGRIRALDPGKAVITATVPGKNVSANADVRVLFTDVTNADAWYFDAVYWALDNNVTSGYGKGTFKPTAGLTRAQTVTFLYNLAGKPNVDGLTAQEFTDVRTSDWYYSAVKWAAANKITSGYGQGTFRPNATCTRSMIVSFLMSYSKLVGTYMPPESSANFPDVPPSAWYKAAVDWAVENGITKGYGAGTFSPDVTCNRAMMVTFLKKTAELPKV